MNDSLDTLDSFLTIGDYLIFFFLMGVMKFGVKNRRDFLILGCKCRLKASISLLRHLHECTHDLVSKVYAMNLTIIRPSWGLSQK